MDNISATGIYRLGLTTLSLDYRKVSDTLVELLIRRIRVPDAPVQVFVLCFPNFVHSANCTTGEISVNFI